MFKEFNRIDDEETEKYNALHLLGKLHNIEDKPALEAEIKKGINHVAVIEFDIENITGKEAIEQFRQRNGNKEMKIDHFAM